MTLKIDEKDLQSFHVIGDRVLIKPKTPEKKTSSGLYLPPGVHEQEKLHSGYIVKTGPGYPIPSIVENDEVWKQNDNVKYISLQAKEGDLAVYLQKKGFEIEFNNQKYILISHSDILMLIRDEGLFD